MSLSTAELTQLRADAQDYMPDTCSILKATEARTTDGGFTMTYSNRATGVACRLAPQTNSQGELLEGDRTTSLSRWILTIPHDQTIVETDRVVHDGQTFEVTHLEDTHSNRTARRVYLRKAD